MIKPNALKKGDKIAIVSLSWGRLGDAGLIHKYYIASKPKKTGFDRGHHAKRPQGNRFCV